MPKIISIYDKPTYDLTDIILTELDEENAILFFKTKHIFKFDKVYGNMTIRSRAMRSEKEECKYMENLISAIIDAWFNWPLNGKIKLTKQWVELCKNAKNLNDVVEKFENAQQIYLFQSTAWNYYNWTSNQPDLDPDIIFSL